ncbi:MAG: chloride channel protein [Planctomycetota bacterium]
MISRVFSRLSANLAASEYRYMILVAAVIGLLGGLGAILFRLLIGLVQYAAYGDPERPLVLFETLSGWHIVLVPVAGGLLIAPIVYYFARETKGHGVPEVMEAVALKHGVIRKRIVAAKTLASAISIGTGGSVGREGPIVQIGSAIGSTIGQLLRTSRSRLRTMVGCGAAAGIAATFNAPVAGVLFSLEVILGDFGVRRFTPIVIASVIATAVSHHFVGDVPAFEIAVTYEMASPFELLTYSLLGVTAGLVALLFIWMIYKSEDLFDSFKMPVLLKPALGGILIGCIGLAFPHIFGVGYETIETALNEEASWRFLFALLGIKLLATSLTLGSGGSGGIFAPSLFLGAVLGGAVGFLVHDLFPGLTGSSGAYALVGMGALVSATTHAPLTSIMIIFEMTGDYKIILPLMFACIIGNLISSRFNPHSIYTLKLFRRGVNLRRGKDVNILASLKVENMISSKYLTIREETQLGEMLQQVTRYPYTCFYVTDPDDTFKGVVAVDDLRRVILDGDVLGNLVIAGDVMDDDVPRIRGEESLDKVMRLFGSTNRSEFPVVDSESRRRLIGVVTRQAVIGAYNSEVLKRDAVSEVLVGMSSAAESEPILLSDEIAIAEVEAPGWMTGKSLVSLNLRRTKGIQVLMITPSEESQALDKPRVPEPDYTVQLGDNLLVMGTADAIRTLKG